MADSAIAAALANRYRIEREPGAGGMGTASAADVAEATALIAT